MQQDTLEKTIAVVAEILCENSKSGAVILDAESSMDTIPEWDSLSFVNVFLAVNTAFGIDPDIDDAMEYRSIGSIVDFVESELKGI
jgi:acyl carrier protein